jgi:hypothetical protein
VVLENRDQDLVPGSELPPGPGVGHEVDGLGAVLGEDDARPVGCANEPSHLVARELVGCRGLDRQPVVAAMHVGAEARVVVGHGVEHGTWLLRRGCGV